MVWESCLSAVGRDIITILTLNKVMAFLLWMPNKWRSWKRRNWERLSHAVTSSLHWVDKSRNITLSSTKRGQYCVTFGENGELLLISSELYSRYEKILKIKTSFVFIINDGSVGWLVGFSFGLEQRNGLLPTVWVSSLRMIRRHASTILIHHRGNSSPHFGEEV